MTLLAGDLARIEEMRMLYAGLDVSSARTAVCVLDADGTVVRQCSVESVSGIIADVLAPYATEIEQVGLEAGPTSAWLSRGLRELYLPVVVIDATHAAAALRTGFRNKTDKNDARGIADLMRVRKFRPVWVKSVDAQHTRALLTVREQLRRQSLDLRNGIWSILQAEGLRPPKLAKSEFRIAVDAALEDLALRPILQPLVDVVEHLAREIAALDRQIAARAKASEPCRRLMTVPGVGPLVALTYIAAVDDPSRFSNRAMSVPTSALRRDDGSPARWTGPAASVAPVMPGFDVPSTRRRMP